MVKRRLEEHNQGRSDTALSVLILAQYFPPDIGGAATRAYNVARGLVLNGCKVTVVTAFPHYPLGEIPREYRLRPLKVEWMQGIRVIRTFILPLKSHGLANRMLLFASFALSSLFALPLVGKTDVIWAANPDILAMIPSMIYGKTKKRPMTTNVDDLMLEDAYALKLAKRGSILSRIGESIARMCYRRARAVTPVSPGYVGQITRYGVKKSRIRVVRGGVDPTIFKPRPYTHTSRRKFTVLYSGAFSLAYDFDQVLRAAKIIENKDNGVEFILQGKGELVDRIKSSVRERHLDNVRIVDQLLSREKVAELLNEADVLIQPLRDFGRPYYGISSKLYEYQAVGKPIICSSKGILGLHVSATQCGIVTNPGDHKAIAAAISRLKRNPKIALEMGRNGRKYVEDNVSTDAIGLHMKRIFEDLNGQDGRFKSTSAMQKRRLSKSRFLKHPIKSAVVKQIEVTA